MSKRRKLDAIMNELKKIKYDLKKIQDEYRLVTSKQTEGDLHPPAECSQHNCPVKGVENRICTMKQQFNEVESEIESLEHMIESDNAENSDEAFFDIENLPEELIMQIFKYLSLDDLCRAGRVSKTWHEMTRSPVFWKKIQANIGESSSSISERASFHLINILPPFVTSISLHFFDETRVRFIQYSVFSKILRERCPNLQHLIIDNVTFELETDELVHFCTELPISVRVLALPNCNFYLRGFCEESEKSEDAVSHIEVLDLSHCSWIICKKFSLTRMPNLKKLRLAGFDFIDDDFFQPIGYLLDQLEILDLERTLITDITFHTIINHSQHLTELYICWTHVDESDLLLIEKQKGFPCLKIICLRGCDVTTDGVLYLINLCPSLQEIFVGNKNENLLTCWKCLDDHATWDFELVGDLGFCNHFKKVNYMLE